MLEILIVQPFIREKKRFLEKKKKKKKNTKNETIGFSVGKISNFSIWEHLTRFNQIYEPPLQVSHHNENNAGLAYRKGSRAICECHTRMW
jgi:ABC-type histidine transport system ATPase subunit